MTSAQRLLATLVLMSTAAVLLRLVSRRAPLPYLVLLAVLGIAVGAAPGFPAATIAPDAILLAFIPGLIFEAALGLRLPSLRRVAAPVTALATAGVFLTVAGIAALAHSSLHLDWTDAAVLGAILAPTDPIAVVGMLRSVRAPSRLVTLLEAESLFNDGTGVAVFAAVIGAVGSTTANAGDVALRFVAITSGGIAIGVAVGLAGAALLAAFREKQTEILLTLAIAYGSYLDADLSHVSGIVAVVAAGITVAGLSQRYPQMYGEELDDFWRILAFILNALLFLLIGGALPIGTVVREAGGVAAAYGIILAVRLLTVHLILGALDLRRRRVPLPWRHVAVWGGMRGALSIALALSVSQRADVDHRVAVLAYGAALASILIQGATIRALAGRVAGDAAPAQQGED